MTVSPTSIHAVAVADLRAGEVALRGVDTELQAFCVHIVCEGLHAGGEPLRVSHHVPVQPARSLPAICVDPRGGRGEGSAVQQTDELFSRAA